MKKYGILSIIFLLFSLLGGIFLVKRNQDNRNQAATGDKCSSGQQLCQKNSSGKNTGFLCKCLTVLDPNDWQCTTKDLNTCPTESGSTDATSGTYKSGCTVNGVVVGTITGRCIQSVSGHTLPQMWKYTCPGRTDLAGGCQQNEQVIPAGSSSVCFENNFCGSQQIDSDDWESCFISVVDSNCTAPTQPVTQSNPTSVPTLTPTKKPSSTPTPTLTPTKIPTSSPVPTNTPVPTSTPIPSSTPTPTSGPTLTPGPSSTPTPGPSSTPVPPTNTPIPTSVIAEGPSPTRIILPESGVEFPSQMLTIFGGIITLLGFLILL